MKFISKAKSALLVLAVCLIFNQVNAFFIHEEVQDLSENSEISSIKILYNDDITSDHLFPDTFWIEVTSNKNGNKYKFEFDMVDDPNVDVPINLWKSDLHGKTFELHKRQGTDGEESWANYQLVNSDQAIGVGTLIRNDKSSASSHSSTKHRHLFRMLGSIAFEGNFIEIVPYITKEQQARKKRSADESDVPVAYVAEYDGNENTHMIKIDSLPDFKFAPPVVTEVQPVEVHEQQFNPFGRQKRQTGRTQYYVEVLLVSDKSAFDLHKSFYQITDADTIHSYMRMYYAHEFKFVNSLYQASFASDTTTNFNIVLTNMLFYEDTKVTTWLNSSIVGTGSTYQGREAIDAGLSLARFASSMTTISSSLPFSYDMAVSVFNKDMYYSGSYSVAGLAYVNTVCASGYKYLIAEDWGSSVTGFVLTHEIGHNLGSDHDGDGRSTACSASDGYIMAPGVTTGLNMYLFSTCSRQSIKNNVLSVTCLGNIPTPTPDLALVANTAQGQIFDANAQCRLRYGNSAVFSQMNTTMCLNLFCATDINATTYWSSGPAYEGTSCGSGMWCSRGSCVANSSAPTGSCLYGDMFLYDTTYTWGMSCEAGIKYYADLYYSGSYKSVCSNSYYGGRCCSSCKKYLAMQDCSNVYSNCNNFAYLCNDLTTKLGTNITRYVCPITCGTCSLSSTCAKYGSLCQNGATCVNNPSGQNGFTCTCPSGYYGALCEYRTTRYNITGEAVLNSGTTTTARISTSTTSSSTTRTTTTSTTTRTTTTPTTTRTTTTSTTTRTTTTPTTTRTTTTSTTTRTTTTSTTTRTTTARATTCSCTCS